MSEGMIAGRVATGSNAAPAVSEPVQPIRRILLVINPGSRRGSKHRAETLRAFADAGVTVRELLTEHPGHAREIIAARDDVWDAVFVLGGDGTVMEVVSALATSDVAVGVLPGGTGNLVASVLGVPRNVSRAVRLLLAGRRRPFDLGTLPDGGYFAFAAGVGVDVAMVEQTSFRGKRWLGVVSYALTASKAALVRQRINVSVTVDGRKIQAAVIMAMIANAGSVLNNRFILGPDIRPDDGELDLCMFTPVTIPHVLALAWRLLRKDFRPHPRMQFVRGRRFVLETETPVSVQADGDIIGRTPLEIGVAPGAIQFLVPRDA